MNYNTKVVTGMQWGDEGKGKISDYFAQKSDIVVRFQGGNNAGHTIEFEDQKFALQHIPSGIFNAKTLNVMGQGMVINPKMLIDEIKALQDRGINTNNLVISDRAHIIMPYHIDLDAAIENFKAKANGQVIGTTKKGIGPAYEDKYGRIGIRLGDFVNPEAFKKALSQVLVIKNEILKAFELKPYDLETLYEEYANYAKILKPLVIETSSLLAHEIESGKKVIFEGAQGNMLCIDNGTYPFVTSSSPTASAIPLGTGLNSKYINEIIGVSKAYTTRVGNGAMPTSLEEVEPELANYIRERGREYGTVTGRKRNVGWIDTVVLKHSVRISGIDTITLTLLDVLSGLDEVKIAYAYDLDGQEIDYIPGSIDVYSRCLPKYITLPGWKEDITKVNSYDQLPQAAKDYIRKIEDIVKVKITYFSVGPDREQTIKIS